MNVPHPLGTLPICCHQIMVTGVSMIVLSRGTFWQTSSKLLWRHQNFPMVCSVRWLDGCLAMKHNLAIMTLHLKSSPTALTNYQFFFQMTQPQNYLWHVQLFSGKRLTNVIKTIVTSIRNCLCLCALFDDGWLFGSKELSLRNHDITCELTKGSLA